MTIENQPELFEDFNNQKQIKFKKPKLFTRKKIYISLSYENIVIFGIIFLMLVVLIFSLGVERGKRINITRRVQKQKSEVSPPKLVEIQKDTQNIENHKSKKVELSTFYTIQVVTYKQDAMVEKELEKLRKEGYQPFVIPSGSLSQICVGRFETKGYANKILTKLRRRYKDCFVRKVE